MTEQEASRIVWEDLHFCGCGDPASALAWVVGALKLIEAKDVLHNQSPQCDQDELDAAWIAIDVHFMTEQHGGSWGLWYWLDGAGLIEHGTSISCSWVDFDRGEGFLEVMRDKDPAEFLKLRWDDEGESV